MRLILASLLMCLLFSPSQLLASQQPLLLDNASLDSSLGSTNTPSLGSPNTTSASPLDSATIELLLERAIADNLIAGGVVVVGNHDGIISTSARGQLNATAGSAPLNERTVFDVASLTKVIATTPAVMKLLDEGKIALSDPLSRWFPEFADAGQGQITILNLLTHTSGLNDIMLSPGQSMQSAIRKAASQPYRPEPGSRFNYADINFILLGELVYRVSGERLDQFCREQVYGPLGAQDTMFLPPGDLAAGIAPTSGSTGGQVQDTNAHRLGGVAGHAGLFSSAYDLSRYARLMLGRGMLDNRRILSEQAMAQMVTPYLCNNGHVKRGLGWDIQSPYSAPKGSFFSEASFGHTGYSGSSIWIDPQQDLFVILLTRRVNYRDTRNFNQLRRDVSTVAASQFHLPGDDSVPAPNRQLAKIAPRLLPATDSPKRASQRRTQLAAQSKSKAKYEQRASRHAGRADRLTAKAGRGHRVERSYRVASRVAKVETCKTKPSSKKSRVHAKRKA